MKLTSILFACGLAAAGLAGAQTSPAKLDKAKLEALLRYVDVFRGKVDMAIDDPKPSKNLPGYSEVTVHLTYDGGARDDQYLVSADGQTIIKGTAYNLGRNPFQGNLDKVTLKDEPSFGPVNAPVTIVEFGDFECPDCKSEAPLLREAVPLAYENKVRVFFKNFPLESIHPWARAAATASRCIYHQDAAAFWKFYDWDYEKQPDLNGENLTENILSWAGKTGLDQAKLKGCIETKATEAEVDASIAEAHALGANGTPTLIINGRKIGGLQWADLQLVINLELQHLGVK